MALSNSKSKVCFFFQDTRFTFSERTRLKKFIEQIFTREKTPLKSLNYIFCTDKALLEINRQFLKHDFYTDIITFDLSDKKEKTAEIYISIERVRDNAEKLGVSFKSELHRVLFHGVLHLCGYKDKSATEKEKMRNKENEYISRYF